MKLTLKVSQISHNLAFSPWAGFYILQSLLIGLALGYSFSLFYAFAFACILLLLWRRAPHLQKIVIGFFSLIAAFYYPFGQTYGAPNFNTFLALHSTNLEEASEMLTGFPLFSYLMALFTFALGVVAVRRKINPTKCAWSHVDSLCLLISLVALVYTPLQNKLKGNEFKLKDIGYPVFQFMKDTIVNNQQVIDETAKMIKLAEMKDNWHVTAVTPRYHTYVVVIGESARRDALGAFGGHWDNTPFASSVNGYLFTDYISAASSTQKSLSLMLAQVVDDTPQLQNNFVSLANRAGFKTWWFSNQGQIGKNDTNIASIAKRADEVRFLKTGDFKDDSNTRDDDLLKMTEQVLSVKRPETQLIVWHIMGSHPKACDRTKGKYTTFVRSKSTSCYLYSMTQTDELLSKLYKQLQETGESFSMVYFSDHGMAFKRRGTDEQFLVHGDKFQQNYQAPFMVLSSDDKAHHVIRARRSANDFMSFFSQWTGIKTQEIKPQYRFVSEQKAPAVYITDFNLQKIDYNRLGTDTFDAEAGSESP